MKTKDKIGSAATVTSGTGIALGGQTVAMGIATTFGTASTGTAISSLSGVAATNAATAWLGGGMAAGTIVLGAIPIVGGAIVAGGFGYGIYKYFKKCK